MCGKHTLDVAIKPDVIMGITLKNTELFEYGYHTSIENNIYFPKGCYVGVQGNLILFDSVCKMIITPYIYDFIRGITYFKGREIQGLSSTTKVIGIGMVE